jgi:PAS domain S-box-containing protein
MYSKYPANDKDQNSLNNHDTETYLHLFNDLPALMWRSGLDGKCNYFNRSWLSFTGRTMQQELGDGWVEGVHPEDVDRCFQTYKAAFEARQPFEMEYRLRHHSGAYRWILDIGRPIRDTSGQFAGFIGTCFDLSDRKQMEKELVEANHALEQAVSALQESETMFKGLFDHAPDAIVVVDQEGKIIQGNHQALKMFGYSRTEIIGRPVEMLLPQAFREKHQRHVTGFMDHPRERAMGTGMALFGLRKDGAHFPVDINLGPLQIGSHSVVLATIRDTTERKKAGEAIREREKMLTTAALSAPVVFFKMDREGVIQYSLGRSLIRRLKNIEPVGRSIYTLYAEMPQVIESFERARNGETLTTIVETRDLVYEATYAPLYDEHGSITGVVGVASDVTRHRQVENALRESESHFRTIFQDAILGIALLDLEGRIAETNQALHEALCYSAEALIGRPILEIVHPEDAVIFQDNLRALMDGRTDHFRMEPHCIKENGDVLVGRLAMSLFRGQDGAPRYGILMLEDITEQKIAQAELAELHRRLADSAELERLHLSQELHDGPLQDLQSISFQASMLQEMLEGGVERAEVGSLLEEVRKVAQSLRSICGDLRPPALAPFGLEKAIRSHMEHFQEQHPDIHLHPALANDGLHLPERVRLALFRIYQQSMTNILRHAGAHNIWVEFSLDDERITLRITDDGKGFEVPRRWIDLVRTGHFGLVGSIERAESVGGRFEVQSAPELGTTIHVEIPRSEDEQLPTSERLSTGWLPAR